jgi:hypothetical protein
VLPPRPSIALRAAAGKIILDAPSSSAAEGFERPDRAGTAP